MRIMKPKMTWDLKKLFPNCMSFSFFFFSRKANFKTRAVHYQHNNEILIWKKEK